LTPSSLLLVVEELNAERHPESQWEFLKYSELKSQLQETILRLLTRLHVLPVPVSQEEDDQLAMRFREEQNKAGPVPSLLVSSLL
jgi:hypothetical protein